MKKLFKVFGILIACILALMIILPFAFHGKIKDIVLQEGNKRLNGEFGFADLDISLFRQFPKVSVSIEDFWLKGHGVFEQDTLVKSRHMEVAVNILSFFGDGGFDISKVEVADTYVKALVLEDGQVNWDIMKTEAYQPIEESADTLPQAPVETAPEAEPSNFRILLKLINLENLNIIYDNRQDNMVAEISHFTTTCSGDMAAAQIGRAHV